MIKETLTPDELIATALKNAPSQIVLPESRDTKGLLGEVASIGDLSSGHVVTQVIKSNA